MPTITVHCIVKNEECFIEASLRSVVSFADRILVYDTGSTDATVERIRRVARDYPQKIIFEERGAVDRARHTALRQEMIDRTTTEWCLIVDGDEIWTARGAVELGTCIARSDIACVMVPFYLCVGDIFHETRRKGAYAMLGKRGWFSPRAFRKTQGVHWAGDYDHDTLRDTNNHIFFEAVPVAWMTERYWHVSHLTRSSLDQDVFSSGGARGNKRRLTYTCIGKKIREPVPEVFLHELTHRKISRMTSIVSFIRLLATRVWFFISSK